MSILGLSMNTSEVKTKAGPTNSLVKKSFIENMETLQKQ